MLYLNKPRVGKIRETRETDDPYENCCYCEHYLSYRHIYDWGNA